VVRRIEFAIGAGDNIGVFERVKAAAWQDFCRLTGYNAAEMPLDDWCKVVPRDEEVVLAFTVEERQPEGAAP
jgi:hypothetical protein